MPNKTIYVSDIDLWKWAKNDADKLNMSMSEYIQWLMWSRKNKK